MKTIIQHTHQVWPANDEVEAAFIADCLNASGTAAKWATTVEGDKIYVTRTSDVKRIPNYQYDHICTLIQGILMAYKLQKKSN